MTKHSKLPPSSAARRVACPGSRALEEKYPGDPDSPYAREGEAAHWVACEMIFAIRNSRIGWPGIAPNGEPITQEMFEGAKLYADTIEEIIGEHNIESLHVEETISISTIHPECFGTPDAWIFLNGTLHIFDYKYGHGFVEVFENWQLIEYAAGILDMLGFNGKDDQNIMVNFYIVQPRAYHPDGHVRQWNVRACDLRSYFNILRDAETEAMREISLCLASSVCRYCTARHVCSTLQRATNVVVDTVYQNTSFELQPKDLGAELRYLMHAAELLDARITGLSEEALAIIKRGQVVPHFSAVPTVGREQWKLPVTDVITMGELLGFNLAKPLEAITPRQAAKAGLSEDIISGLAERPRGALKLVLDDINKTRKLFGSKK